MNMVKVMVVFIIEKICYVCGVQVECVIVDICIVGMVEFVVCEEKFSSQNVGVIIIVMLCWCYGSEIIDMDLMCLKVIWGFNGIECFGVVYFVVVLVVYSQKGILVFFIYGYDVQDVDDIFIFVDVEEKLLCFVWVGLVVVSMKGKSYFFVGGVLMGIVGFIVDYNFFEFWLGMKV